MNTNQQTPISSTTKEQNKLVEMTQGGCLSRIYRNYSFEPVHEKMSELHEPDTVNEYLEIVKELVAILSEGRAVCISLPWKKRHMPRQNFWGKWTTEFVEDGSVATLKQKLKNGEYGKQLWADYMWYEQRMTKSIFLQLPSEIRIYRRELCVIQDNFEEDILDAVIDATYDDRTDFGVRIFPHSKIEHLGNDKETIRNYIHRDDFIAQIASVKIAAGITIEVNHNYMNYEQMLELMESLFEKRDIIIKDRTDPYIYANYPPDAIEYNEHPCAGYEFIE